MNITIKRVYEKSTKEDGKRILIDRLWPRGLTKEKADIGLWLKDIAPSTELRQWFGHDVAKWQEFKKRYVVEIEKNNQALSELEGELKRGKATLVYAAKDEEHNDAVVLKEYLEKK